MPALQSTTPDYYAKSGVVNALIQDDALAATVPSWATTATLRYKSKNAASSASAGSTVGSIAAGGPTPTLSVELDTSATTLEVGLYDAEWEFTDGAAKKMRMPSGNFKLLEIVEALP